MNIIKKRVAKYIFAHPACYESIKILTSSRCLVNNKLYKKFILKRAKEYAQKYAISKKSVFIETTLDCNAKCVFCYHSKKKLIGTMTMDLFKKIIDDCHANNITNVVLSLYGEVLMDKFLFERIQYLRKYGMTYKFITNGFLLDKEKVERLFSLGGLTSITFSVNGYSKEVYEKIMVGLNRDITYKNILYFLNFKEKLRQKDIEVSISIVKNRLNNKDFKDFFKFWIKQTGVSTIWPAELIDRMGDDYGGEFGPLGRNHRRGNWLSPCKDLWDAIYIFFDGRVAPCCDDNDLRKLIIGDMKKESLEQIDTGKSIEYLRKVHLEDKRLVHNICGKCYSNSSWISNWIV